MEKDGFEQLFHERMQARLGPYGFSFQGRSLTLKDELNTISLIRLGGKMAVEGAITHLLCFRHSFLRDMKEAVPKVAPGNPHDYPYKFRPSDIQRRGPLAYSSQNLNFPRDRYYFSAHESAAVSVWIEGLADMLEGVFLPWVAGLTPARAHAEVRELGNGDWCERLWDEDYKAWLAHRP